MNISQLLLLAILIMSCETATTPQNTIAQINVNLVVDRFDTAIANSTPDALPKLKSTYPYLFPQQFPDSLWRRRMNDSLQRKLLYETEKQFPDLKEETAQLRSLFQHAVYYFPEINIPKIVTITSDVDYHHNIIYTDSLLLISLDTYLGESHHFYQGIPYYLKKNFTKTQIVVDVATSLAQRKILPPKSRTFLAQLIYYGKQLYVKDLLLPSKSEAEKIGYTPSEWQWATANEAEIWRYFITNTLLFSTDSKLRERFIYPAPFSKFYLSLDKDAPGKIGQYIGWQIVQSYMKNNTLSLHQLLNSSAEEIFNNSKYKPRK